MRVKDSLLRHQDILPPDKTNAAITIIGAGAIGSFTALALAKMGFDRLNVWDYDKVEAENLNAQLYGPATIGSYKAQALAGLVEALTGVGFMTSPIKYNGQELGGIVIAAVDSMDTRRKIWQSAKNSDVTYIIDPRMASEFAVLYTMRPHDKEDIEAYEITLHSDDNSIAEPCTGKSTAYCALLLSGLVAKAVKDIVTNNPYPRTASWNVKENCFQTWSKK